jgi:hypothetical protein
VLVCQPGSNIRCCSALRPAQPLPARYHLSPCRCWLAGWGVAWTFSRPSRARVEGRARQKRPHPSAKCALAKGQQSRVVSQRRVRLLVGEARLVPHTCCVAARGSMSINERSPGLVAWQIGLALACAFAPQDTVEQMGCDNCLVTFTGRF